MEAIFRDGGRQYKVTEGQTLDVDFREAEPGSTLEFPEVLYVGSGAGDDSGEAGGDPKIGSPLVAGAKVVAKVVDTVKGPKLVVANFRRRKNSRRRVGHRQKYTQVRVEKIES